METINRAYMEWNACKCHGALESCIVGINLCCLACYK